MAGKESFWCPWVPDRTRGRRPAQGLEIAVDAWSTSGHPDLWVLTVARFLLRKIYVDFLTRFEESEGDGPLPLISDSSESEGSEF